MKPLIRVAEVWVPDAEGYLLELADGLYGSAVAFGAISRTMCFGRGEGLPGRVWEEGRPILLKDLQGGGFRRASAARAAGLVGAVGMPVFFGDSFKAVLVFLCGGANWGAGAVELWCNRPEDGDRLVLVDGFYGATAAGFEAHSRSTPMRRGVGLPGIALARGTAVFFDALAGNADFQRAEAATADGLRHAMAVPFPVPGNETYVLTFLSSAATPIAQRLETWSGGHGAGLQRTAGYCEIDGLLDLGEAADLADAAGLVVASAYASALPRVLQRTADDPDAIGTDAALVGASGLVAFPVAQGSAVNEAVVLYL